MIDHVGISGPRRKGGLCGVDADAALTPVPQWASVAHISNMRAKMTRIISVMVLAIGMLGFAAGAPAPAQTVPGAEVSPYDQPPVRRVRPRPRINVAPYPYRSYSTTFPVPYPADYPGPGFVRQCTSWLAPENRVAGPVIVPKMRCWWRPG
jgi:hypothetical protein